MGQTRADWLGQVWGERRDEVLHQYEILAGLNLVIADLAIACNFIRSPLDIGSEYLTAVNLGKREAYAHILSMMGVTDLGLAGAIAVEARNG